MLYTYVENVCHSGGGASLQQTTLNIRVLPRSTKVGVMIVGLAGNNGSTFQGVLNAHKTGINWKTRTGVKKPLFLGSLSQSATVAIGRDADQNVVYSPIKTIADLVEPNYVCIGGWDICNKTMMESLETCQVLDPDCIRALRDANVKGVQPRPSIFYPSFVAANQKQRATNVIPGDIACPGHLQAIRKDIRDFKEGHQLEQVIVLFSATTERAMIISDEIHGSGQKLLAAVERSDCIEIAPSLMFGLAAVLEGAIFLNGGPQNTIVKGLVELAKDNHTFVGGSDFKTGQTKLKSVLADYWNSAGFRLRSVVSYNHLGNNDGHNLSEPNQFRSKEKSKSDLLTHIVETNQILFPAGSKPPDHEIVIKYVPSVGDHKRALDEYLSDICMEEQQSLVVYNVCPDSLLCVSLMLDLVLFSDWLSRIRVKNDHELRWRPLNTTLDQLAYFFKAPISGQKVSGSLFEQRASLMQLILATRGLTLHQPMAKL